MMSLAEVAALTGGRAHGEARITGVETDTRRLGRGQLFVALRGPRFDGHRFLGEAAAAGAAAALVEVGREPEAGDLPTVAVADTGAALLALAGGWRQRFTGPVVGVTGSAGKTTVKEMLAAVLASGSPSGSCHATPGNWNNTVGLPLTLFGLRPEHRYAVLELGINRPGEMAELAATAEPDVALVTNAGAAHLEGLGGVEGVAREKGRLYQFLRSGGTAVINADSPFAEQWAAAAEGRVLRFGLEADADVRGRWAPDGEGILLQVEGAGGAYEVRLPLPGAHSAANALAAAAVAAALEIPGEQVSAGLAGVAPPSGRLQPRQAPAGFTVLDDTYNANPTSLQAALAVLAEGGPGHRWLVLGDMGELGGEARHWHQWAGEQARRYGVSHLVAVGEQAGESARAFGEGAETATDWEEALPIVEKGAGAGDRVLVKGSRAMGMERLVAGLMGEAQAIDL
jgi:UDP-N-acetylmuramoyl-tripeptide--D-alanyl-D-alanine ligase